MQSAPINVSASGDQTLIAGVNGSAYAVYGMILVAAGSVSVTIKNGSTALTGPIPLAASSQFSFPLNVDTSYASVTPGNALVINLSGATQVSGIVYYQTSVVG